MISNRAIYELEKDIKETKYMRYKKYNTLHYDFYKKIVQNFLKRRTKKYDMIHNMIKDIENLGDIIHFCYLYHEKLKKWLYIDMYDLKNIKIKDLNMEVKELNKNC